LGEVPSTRLREVIPEMAVDETSKLLVHEAAAGVEDVLVFSGTPNRPVHHASDIMGKPRHRNH
jgi:hypothetical protein